MAVLQVRDLRTEFTTDDGNFPAVDGVSFAVEAGKTLAIVGESGCGKSVTALSIMGLVPDPPGRVTGGSIRFEGRELVGAPMRELLDLRGNGMAMIFQEPMSSLNPAFTIGDQIVEGLLRHRPLSRAQAQARAIDVLRQVREDLESGREGVLSRMERAVVAVIRQRRAADRVGRPGVELLGDHPPRVPVLERQVAPGERPHDQQDAERHPREAEYLPEHDLQPRHRFGGHGVNDAALDFLRQVGAGEDDRHQHDQQAGRKEAIGRRLPDRCSRR